MKAKIISSSVSHDPAIKSSVAYAADAAKSCIEKSGIDLNDIDYLINVGVYRDHNIVEPALAAMIQKEIGLNLDFTRFEVPSTAFSCDLINGVNGALNAFQLADALFKNGKARNVLVVSSDMHPSGETHPDATFKPCGSALLLAPANDTEPGFEQFELNGSEFDRSTQIGESEFASIDFKDNNINARNQLDVERADHYIDNLKNLILDRAQQFIKDHNISLSRTALIIPSVEHGFASNIGQQLGFSDPLIADVWDEHEYPHSSAFGCGYDQLKHTLPDTEYDHILYVGAGAGMNAACALYRA